MLGLGVTLENDRLVINGLAAAAVQMPNAVNRGLSRVAKGAHRSAFELLSGLGAGKDKETGLRTGAGEYPVPVRTGNLRRLLNWVKPGATKSSNGLTFAAGSLETIIYDSAEYSNYIHDGEGSSDPHGSRPFLEDGVRKFNGNDRIGTILMDEVDAELNRRLKLG